MKFVKAFFLTTLLLVLFFGVDLTEVRAEASTPTSTSSTPTSTSSTPTSTSSTPTSTSSTPTEPEVIRLENPIYKLNPSGERQTGLTGEKETEGETNIFLILGRIAKKALGYLGGVTLLVFIYGGFMWLVSAGNPERVKTGTQSMSWALIGLFIIFSSYAILDLIISSLTGK